MKLNIPAAAAALLLGMATCLASAQPGIVLGAAPWQSEGRIQGNKTMDYQVQARAGQYMQIQLYARAGSCFFNLYGPGNDKVAIFNGSVSGERHTVQVIRDGVYRIRVYQMRVNARRNKIAQYQLEVREALPATSQP